MDTRSRPFDVNGLAADQRGAWQVAVIEECNAPAPGFQETLAYESRDFGQRRPPV